MSRSADPRFVRQWNEYIVFEVLREAAGPLRISDLAKETGLTAASLGQVLRGLESKEWVRSAGAEEQRRGRPAQVYSLKPQPGWVLGVELSVHAARVVRMSLQGEVAARHEVRVEAEVAVPDRVAIIRDALASVLERDDDQPVWLTGIAASGAVGAIVRTGEPLDGSDQTMAQIADELLAGGPWSLFSDAHAAVWAEHVDGAAKGLDDVLLAHLGWRPTLAMLVGGRPRTGARGVAGDLRWDMIEPVGDPVSWPPRLLERRGNHIHDIVRAALEGDPDAIAGAQEYMRAAIPPVVFAANLMDPCVVVLGGAFSPLAHLSIGEVIDALEERMENPPEVVISELDEYVVALGAAHLARKDVIDKVVSPTGGVQELIAEAIPPPGWDSPIADN